MNNATTTTIDLGNNETATIGIVEGPEGFLAMTFTASKMFKTSKGAEAWLARKGFNPNGTRIAPSMWTK